MYYTGWLIDALSANVRTRKYAGSLCFRGQLSLASAERGCFSFLRARAVVFFSVVVLSSTILEGIKIKITGRGGFSPSLA